MHMTVKFASLGPMMHQAYLPRLWCTFANIRESSVPLVALYRGKRTRLTLTRDWQTSCQLYRFDSTTSDVICWCRPLWGDGSRTTGSSVPAPGAQRFVSIARAELIKKDIYPNTVVFLSGFATNYADVVSEPPGTLDIDHFWSERMESFKAWWKDPLITRDQSFASVPRYECRADSGPLRSTLLEEYNECTKHHVCS
jgi:hypothetical protein